MDKRVLLIGKEKSFMVNAIEKGLEKENYEVCCIEPSSDKIKQLANKPEIYVLYLGDLTPEDVEVFKYLDEAIDSERFLLYLIGNKEELEHP